MDDVTTDTSLEPRPPAGPKRLVRSRSQRMFLGICGGLGEYFDIDPTVVRLVFTLGLLAGGASIAVYAVLALVMPAEDAADLDPRAAAQETLNEASTEARRAIDLATTRVKGLFGKSEEPPPPAP